MAREGEYGKEIGGLYAGEVGNRKGDFLKREIWLTEMW
jgi:hypothetical protein